MLDTPAIISGMKEERQRLMEEIGRINTAMNILSGEDTHVHTRRRMSNEARERISKAQRARWMKRKQASLHWTKRAENKDRVRAITRKMARARKAKMK